jgi:hypothetical protein
LDNGAGFVLLVVTYGMDYGSLAKSKSDEVAAVCPECQYDSSLLMMVVQSGVGCVGGPGRQVGRTGRRTSGWYPMQEVN